MQKQQYSSQWALLGKSKAELLLSTHPKLITLYFDFMPFYKYSVEEECYILCNVYMHQPPPLQGHKPSFKIPCSTNLIEFWQWKQLFAWDLIEFIEEHKAQQYFITVLWVFDLPLHPGVCSSWWALTAAECTGKAERECHLALTGVGLHMHTQMSRYTMRTGNTARA